MINPDLPIKKLSEDTLGRKSFARNLASTLMNYSLDSSCTIGLYGEWGSGKTSLLNMVLDLVENESKETIILKFNPWLCSDSKQLISQFFKQLATAIKLKKPKDVKTWELIDQYAELFDVVNLIPGAGSYLALLWNLIKKKAKQHVDEANGDLQEKKNQIIAKMLESNLRIIVAIDDIDRLSEAEIIAVFQLVKALADFPNTIYLLSFDYNVVVNALSKVQHGDGKEYLEKIIQVPFEIPAPDMASIHHTLFSRLDSIIGTISEERWDSASWAELFEYGIKRYIKSIRDVIRYTNVFLLKYELLKDETDIVDLLGLTCLQVFEPTIYSNLPYYKDSLCGDNRNYSSDRQKQDEAKVKRMIDALITNNEAVMNSEAAPNILGLLFPRTRSITHAPYSIGKAYVYKTSLINHNIVSEACFDRYFSLTLENGAIPSASIRHLIFEAPEDELENSIDHFVNEEKIVRFLDEIDGYANRYRVSDLQADRVTALIRSFSKKWNSIKVEDNGMFTYPFQWRFLNCAASLLKLMADNERYDFMLSLFHDKEVPPSILALFLQEFGNQYGRYSNKEENNSTKLLTLEDVTNLEMIFKNRAIEALDTKEALAQRDGLNFLWMLSQIDPDLTQEKKKTLVSDDLSLVRVLVYCSSPGRVAGRIVTKTRKIDLQRLAEFIEIDAADQRLRKLKSNPEFLHLPLEDQMDIVTFIMVRDRENEDSLYDGHIADEVVMKERNKIIMQLSQN